MGLRQFAASQEDSPDLPADDPSPDAVLRRFVEAPEALADDILDHLLGDFVRPVMDRILLALGGRSGTMSGDDLSDLRGEIQLQLLERLRSLRTEPSGQPISDLAAYVAGMTRHACWNRWRRQDPARVRLRRRLGYLFASDPRFVLSRGEDRQWLCALQGQETLPRADSNQSIADLVVHHLVHAGGSLPLSRLVTAIADAEVRARRLPEPTAHRLESVQDCRPDPMTELLFKYQLGALWSEICALPQRQIAALLLNLRDREGRSALTLLPATGTATFQQIDAVLQMSECSLYDVWNRLPLEDREIGALLGMTRQQVINLRKSARERLTRRMARRGYDR